MKAVLHLPVAEQYPSSTATVSGLASNLISGIFYPAKKSPSPKGGGNLSRRWRQLAGHSNRVTWEVPPTHPKGMTHEIELPTLRISHSEPRNPPRDFHCRQRNPLGDARICMPSLQQSHLGKLRHDGNRKADSPSHQVRSSIQLACSPPSASRLGKGLSFPSRRLSVHRGWSGWFRKYVRANRLQEHQASGRNSGFTPLGNRRRLNLAESRDFGCSAKPVDDYVLIHMHILVVNLRGC